MKFNINKLRNKFVYTFLGIMFGLYIFSRFTIINVTESLPKGLYFLTKFDEKNIKKGDIITFDIPNDIRALFNIPKSIEVFIKEVGALNSDSIAIENNNLFINGKLWGKIYKTDNTGRVLNSLNKEDLTPKLDEFLPLAPADRSYDGRYYGPIKISQIKNNATLLIKF